MRFSARSVFILSALLALIVAAVLIAQSSSPQAPFQSTPTFAGKSKSGSSTAVNVFARKGDGSYAQFQFLYAPPYTITSNPSALSDYLSAGSANLLAYPRGPAGVGLASKIIDGGKFSASGTVGAALADQSRNRGSISVFLISTSAIFSGTTLYPVGPQTSGVIAEDLNGDSVLDLAVPFAGDFNGPNGGVGILVNQGDGTFRSSVSYAAGTRPSGIAIYDLNRDNRLDIAVSDQGSNSVSVLLGLGNGIFGAPVSVPIGAQSLSVTIADLNGDGNPDIAATCADKTVRILLGNGSGAFTAGATLTTGANPRSIAAADFNKDGRLDLATVNGIAQTVSVFTANGNGTFQPATTYATGYTPGALVVTDYDQDGNLDLLVANGDARMIAPDYNCACVNLFLGNGNGSFRGLRLTTVGSGASGSLSSLSVADFNGDGKVDVLANNGSAGSTGQWYSTYAGNGDGTFSSTGTPVSLGAQSDSPNAVATGDFNGDGRVDIAAATGGSFSISVGRVVVLLNNGSGFGAPTSYDSGGVNPTGILATDLDGDGRLDLAVTNRKTGSASVLRGNANGTFQLLQTYNTGGSPASVAAADFNGDGRPDLAIGNAGEEFQSPAVPGGVFLLTNTGGGAFSQPVSILGSPMYVNKVTAADIDGDGKPDLIANGTRPPFNFSVAVLKSNGNGTFQPATFLSTDFGPQEMAVRDFNLDGKADIVIAHCCGDTDLTYFQGNGDGTFSTETHFAGPASPITVTALDLNQDGAPDLIVGGSDGSVAGMLNTAASAPGSPSISSGGIANSASYSNASIAPGSFFSIFGSNLGPQQFAKVEAYPLPKTLAGTSVRVVQNGINYDARMVFTSAGQVNAVLPSTVPAGDAQVIVTYSGKSSSPAAIRISGTSLGVFFQRTGGSDLAIAQNVASASDYPLNTPDTPAKPGQIVILWATGMGAIPGPDDVPPPGGDMTSIPVSISVGGVAATRAYAGRAPGVAAVDNIYFTVPVNAPLGCTVPVTINAAQTPANTVQIAITATGAPCR